MALLRANTTKGIVVGTYSGNPEISAFKGIPYAKPPVGKRRWAPPEPIDSWEGEFIAKEFKEIPIQVEERHPFYSHEFYKCRKPMSEDCLFLNIWTPAESENDRLPVMFFIHGGGFKSGYSHEIAFDGDGLAKEGVILVTIEYRLGSFGYLAHEELVEESDKSSAGNYGLQDQIAALNWVRENIHAFGGDCNNITIFGQSAGAMSVENLITSPVSKNKMSQAIMQSAGGYVLNNRSSLGMLSLQEACKQGRSFIEFLECKSISEARELDANYIAEKEREYIEVISPNSSFLPIIDGYYQVESTADAVKNYRYADIPYIIGTTEFENGAATYLPDGDPELFKESVYQAYGEDASEFMKIIGFDENPEKAMLEGGWDDMLKPGIFAWADHAAENKALQPTYLYYLKRKMPGDSAGAFHSSDLWYEFGTLNRCWRNLNGVDFELSNAIIKYWTNFAKNGNPNGEGLEEWIPYSASERKSLILDEKIEMSDFCGSQRTRFIVDKILNQ